MPEKHPVLQSVVHFTLSIVESACVYWVPGQQHLCISKHNDIRGHFEPFLALETNLRSGIATVHRLNGFLPGSFFSDEQSCNYFSFVVSTPAEP